MASKAEYLLALNTWFFMVTWISVLLRVYVRARVVKAWGLDDWLILATQLIFSVLFALNIVQINHGAGKHMSDINSVDYTKALQYWWLCIISYTVCCSTLKLSIGVLLLRFTIQPIYTFVIYLLMSGTVVVGVAYAMFIIFHCHPVSDFWTFQQSGCVDSSLWLDFSYTASALSALADWMYGILPIFVIWKLQVSKRTKAIVAGVLGFGAIGSIATVIRTSYIRTLKDPDFEWATAELTILSNIEVGVGITASCIATVRPLLRVMSDRYRNRQSSHTNRVALVPGYSSSLWPSYTMGAESNSCQAYSLTNPAKSFFLPPTSWRKKASIRRTVDQGVPQGNKTPGYNIGYLEMV
ncbi:hypothetical protein BDV33DRAFT_209697 [Aspergillus novoparasiticus]|uniref:Rhodopsin domain-containing protein n=1 Tax=Aspergillus novoparasiticus TaxID=986946 RepID=A0A5N6EB03_9EURO|nr:hypothetical protein BDV33DRAFT_209697 [Aspergillus novoparasiticus]